MFPLRTQFSVLRVVYIAFCMLLELVCQSTACCVRWVACREMRSLPSEFNRLARTTCLMISRQSQGPILFITIGICVYTLAVGSLHSYLIIVLGKPPSEAEEYAVRTFRFLAYAPSNHLVSSIPRLYMIASAWVLSIVLVMSFRIISWVKPSIYDWGYRNDIWCAINHSNKAAQAALISILLGPPLLLMLFCYTSIYCHIRKVTDGELGKFLRRGSQTSKAQQYQFKAALNMALFVLVFLASWAGVLFLVVIGGGTRRDAPWWGETLVITLAHLSGVFVSIELLSPSLFIRYGINGVFFPSSFHVRLCRTFCNTFTAGSAAVSDGAHRNRLRQPTLKPGSDNHPMYQLSHGCIQYRHLHPPQR